MKNNGYLPGLNPYFPEPTQEELEKQERQFCEALFNVVSENELIELADNPDSIKDIAQAHGLPLPESIARKLRTWEGKDSFQEIKKLAGMKQETHLNDLIHDYVPVTVRGFTKIEKKGIIEYTRRIGDKEITIFSKRPDFTPVAGDLVKRLFMGTCLFANQRGTHDPGPIKFREILELVGKLDASQPARERIKNYLESFAYGGIEIRKRDDRGKEIYFRYAPFFVDFIWDGGLDFSAKIYPVFNERIFQMLLEENILQYVWIDRPRFRGLPGLTDRDCLCQDMFKKKLGLRECYRKMRKWLHEYGEFTDARLKKLSLGEIKDFVNRNFSRAVSDDLVIEFKIRRYQNKKAYLNQTIWWRPGKAKKPHIVNYSSGELEEMVQWLYEAGEEDGAYIKLDAVKERLTNAARAGHFDCLKEARDRVESDYDETYPVAEDSYGEYQNRPMMFWQIYQTCKYRKDQQKQ